MSSGSISTDLTNALSDIAAIDTIVAGWVSSYNLSAGASTSFNGAGFATDGGNNAAGQLIARLQSTVMSLQKINHG